MLRPEVRERIVKSWSHVFALSVGGLLGDIQRALVR
jgi:hypothetical protein